MNNKPTQEKRVDVFTQDNNLIFQLKERGSGETWDTRAYANLMPYGVREAAFIKSFTGTYVLKLESDAKKSNLEHLKAADGIIANLRKELQVTREQLKEVLLIMESDKPDYQTAYNRLFECYEKLKRSNLRKLKSSYFAFNAII